MLRKVLSLIDFFLVRHSKDVDKRVRARIFALFVLITALYIYVMAFLYIFFGAFPQIPLSIILFNLALFLFLPLALRLSRDHEWLYLVLAVIGLLIWTYELAVMERSFITPIFLATCVHFLMGLFFITTPSKRYLLVILSLSFQIINAFLLRDVTLEQLLTIKDDRQLDLVYSTATVLNIFLLIILFGYIYVRNLTLREIETEIEQRVAAVRLSEISNILKSMIPEFQNPMLAIGDILDRHQAQETAPREDEIERIAIDLTAMRGITLNFGWIYRAFRKEVVNPVSATHFAEQLRLCIRGKLNEAGWGMEMKVQDSDIHLYGKIPLALVLILTIIDHVIQSYPRSRTTILRIEFAATPEVSCSLSWQDPEHEFAFAKKASDDVQELFEPNNLRLQLIFDLTRECNAKLELSSERDRTWVRISGDWAVAPA